MKRIVAILTGLLMVTGIGFAQSAQASLIEVGLWDTTWYGGYPLGLPVNTVCFGTGQPPKTGKAYFCQHTSDSRYNFAPAVFMGVHTVVLDYTTLSVNRQSNDWRCFRHNPADNLWNCVNPSSDVW